MKKYFVIFLFNSRCCKVCAKIEGESCGGPGNFSGICEEPLKCISKPPLIGAVGICLGKIENFIVTLN